MRISAMTLRRAGILSPPAIAAIIVLFFIAFQPFRDITTTTDLAKFLSGPVNKAFLTLGYILLLGLALWQRKWRELLLIPSIGIGLTLIILGLKAVTGDWFPRPNGVPGGLPSGHAAASFALAYLLSRRFGAMAYLWYLIAAGISWSRVEVHAHWAYQVALGMPFGLGIARGLERLWMGGNAAGLSNYRKEETARTRMHCNK